jgi:hypothetical protein
VVKAVRFYQLAGDINRTAAILDRALWRCSTALVRMSTVLTVHNSNSNSNNNDNSSSSSGVVDFLILIPKGLRMHPVHPSGPSVTGQTILADYWDLSHYSESQPAVLLKDLTGTIQAIGDNHFLLKPFSILLCVNTVCLYIQFHILFYCQNACQIFCSHKP